MNIYKLTEVTGQIELAFKNLIPQLSSSCVLPTKKDLEYIVNSENTILFVAEDAGVVLGVLTLVFNRIPTGNKVWIEDVVVDKKARGKGVGKALVNFAIAYTSSKNINSINLTSSPERVAANKLYQKLGFVKRETNVYRLTIT
ncbi:GNAT family N-acetyltransferase [Algibacter sp. PT7-4]|uniref:GNAT family N-acetyltransferase n=1 Tax=Algibacter ulvanivorans TaxID=3400999 RepID=UPI003AB0FC92